MNWTEREYRTAADRRQRSPRIQEMNGAYELPRTAVALPYEGIGSADVETYAAALNQFRLLNDMAGAMSSTGVNVDMGPFMIDGEIGALLREATIPARMLRSAPRDIDEDEFDGAVKGAAAAMRRLRSRTENTWDLLKRRMEMEDERK